MLRIDVFLRVLMVSHVLRHLTLATDPLPRKPLDLADPDQLTRALQLRMSQNKQLIIFAVSTSDESEGMSTYNLLAQNLIVQLEERGYSHWIAISPTEASCENLHKTWHGAPSLLLSCAYSSEPYRSHGVAGFPPSHELVRYFVLTAIAERGVDVLLMDTDFELNHDIYETLLAPPLTEYEVVGLKESPLNGGLMYIRGTKAHRKGGGLWYIREVVRRSNALSDAVKRGDFRFADVKLGADQEMLTTAIGVAAGAVNSGKVSEWDFRDLYQRITRKEGREGQFWVEHPQDDTHLGPMTSAVWRDTVERYSLPAHMRACPSADPSVCGRLERFLAENGFVNAPIRFVPVCTPHDSPYYDPAVPCEKVAFGPNWLWSLGGLATYGWNVTAAVHLLHANKIWKKGGEGSGHAGRLAFMIARGKLDMSLIPSPPEGKVLVQEPDDEWLRAAEYNHSHHARHAVRAFSERAVAQGSVPAFTNFSCDSEWIIRHPLSRTGILDHRVVETNDGRCYPSPFGRYCFLQTHYMYDFMVGRGSAVATRPLVPADKLKAKCPQLATVLE